MVSRYNLQLLEDMQRIVTRAVEHGFVDFFNRMDLYCKKATSYLSQEDQQFQSAAIKMDNIWVYIYMYAVLNGLSAFIFLCEIVAFYRNKIWRDISRRFNACRRWIAVYWRKSSANVHAIYASIRNAVNRFVVRLRAFVRTGV